MIFPLLLYLLTFCIYQFTSSVDQFDITFVHLVLDFYILFSLHFLKTCHFNFEHTWVH